MTEKYYYMTEKYKLELTYRNMRLAPPGNSKNIFKM